VIGESFRAHALLWPIGGFGIARKAARRILARPALRGSPAIGFIIRAALGVAHGHVPILLEMRHRAFRRIDRDVREVGAAQPLDLRVEVREVAPLQQRIVREVDAGRHVLRHESDLLGLREEVVDDTVEHQASHDAYRHQFLWDDLGRVEDVEIEAVGKGIVKQLDAQFPLGEIARVDRIPKIAAMEIRVGAVDLDRFVPDDRLQALLGLPVEFDERGCTLRIDKAERVHPEALDRAERPRNCPVRHDPHDHVHAFGGQADEVPEVVVRGLRLGEVAIRFGLGSVDQVGELYGILDEEHRDVIADEIPVAFLRVELDRKTANVTGKIRRAFTHALEHIGAGHIGETVGKFEIAVGTVAARMHDALGNALVVEVEDLLAKMRIFKQRWPARALLERVLVIRHGNAVLCRQCGNIAAGNLACLSTRSLRLGIGHRYRGIAWHSICLLGGLTTDIGGRKVRWRYFAARFCRIFGLF